METKALIAEYKEESNRKAGDFILTNSSTSHSKEDLIQEHNKRVFCFNDGHERTLFIEEKDIKSPSGTSTVFLKS